MIVTGDVLNHTYEIQEQIGQGGAGIIYLAYHKRLQKKVVIKKIKDDFHGIINERTEVDLLKKLRHMYLPQVYDFFQIEGQIFTVMDYIEGKTLFYYLNHNKRFSERQILHWMRQLCAVIAYLHHQKPAIIHSDIKPSNIMITSKGDICLIDFNISIDEDKTKGVSGFSRRYASPEQLYNTAISMNRREQPLAPIDTRSDIYSLGITLYHVLTGIKPPEDYRRTVPLKHCKTPYCNRLVYIVSKAMMVNPDKRYQSIDDMNFDIQNMKRQDRQKNMRRSICWILGVVFLAAGICGTCVGYQNIQREHFIEEYKEVSERSLGNDYDRIISQGISVLNNRKYKSAMLREKSKKADILYMIADSYFKQVDYENAVTFYKEAISVYRDNPKYFQNYAIALARQNQTAKAEEILQQAIESGLGDAQIHLIQTEIARAVGN